MRQESERPTGMVFDVDTFATEDGPGIRMAVYLKGCPLRCKWCHSPESRRGKAEVILMGDRCSLCGLCDETCPQGVHSVDGQHQMDRSVCLRCGICVENCPNEALQMKGRVTTVVEIIERAIRMRPFFEHSGGGVTLTGGEVTQQAPFAEAILRGCRKNDIHTAIETCGACRWEWLERVADQSDLILFDLKLMDESAHLEWTGSGNATILSNLARLEGRNVQIRVPLIPGVTDTEENLSAICTFASEHGFRSIGLLRYNASAGARYDWLGESFTFAGDPQTSEQIERLNAMVEAAGLVPAEG